MYSQLEVKFTRLELAGQKKEMIEQNKTLRRQRFENTFFQLIRNHNDIINNIDIKASSGGSWTKSAEGRDSFEMFYKQGLKRIAKNNASIDHTLDAYKKFFTKNQSDLGHYFRHVYHIIKYTNTSPGLSDKEKYQYISLLRAMLSSFELVFLFYNGLSEYGREKMKPLLEKYSIFKSLDKGLLLNQSHIEQYSSSAFTPDNSA